ncbi:MAG TPA: thiamine-phosphate kinase [Candidatus Binatia bacterium]|nr:thiamine-phosphate kinase [Candidatus Binatia bacterium]
MKLSRLGEFGLIERVRRKTPLERGVNLGIGDDAAWVQTRSGSCLLTADLLIEGVHFDLKWTSLYALGYKTLAVNMSDIAAMGGIPAYLLLSLGIPAIFDSKDVEEFYRGIHFLALKSGVALVGGDTSVAKSLFISASLVGHAPHRPITRSGAAVGDDIYVTGTLGDSALGLNLLKRKRHKLTDPKAKFLLSRHHFPTPRFHTGATLAKEKLARAMIDISDGLLQDLGHICKASRVGAIIAAEKLPLSAAYRSLAGPQGIGHALAGGEDYELLFCARRSDRAHVERLRGRFDVPITRIGTCVPPRDGIKILNPKGQPMAFHAGGHDHFKQG